MITAKPLDYFTINHFSIANRMELIQGNAATCYIQLFENDIRYVPTAGSIVQLKFPRALTVAATPANQDTTITCVAVDVRDASVYSVTFTSAQIDAIVSGGVKLVISTGGVAKTYPVDEFVLRRTNSPGA